MKDLARGLESQTFSIIVFVLQQLLGTGEEKLTDDNGTIQLKKPLFLVFMLFIFKLGQTKTLMYFY